jgi:thiol-disulfide isomerase/thioredoxin
MSARPIDLIASVWLFTLGCGDAAKPEGAGRSEVVVSSASSAQASTKPSASAALRPAPHKKICASPPAADGKKLPAVELGHVEADGAPALEGPIETGGGAWTWVNLWAGYCGPCKQEIPLLLGWKADLAKQKTPIHLAFVSLDDDERQAKQFLSGQPKEGLRSSFLLTEGKPRGTLLKELGLRDPPDLPVHVLLDPEGAVRCVIQGAIEPDDFAQVSAIVAKR